jgi:hypothetical protein
MVTTTRVHRHGVVVVHGQGADRPRGSFLASVANGIADTFELQGGTVERRYDLRGGPHARAVLEVTPPADTGAPPRRYEFAEAYWDDAFPPPRPHIVYRWALVDGWRQVASTMRGWLSDPANDRRGEDAPDMEALPLPRMVRTAYFVQVLLLRVLLVIGYILWLPAVGLLFVLSILGGTPGLRLWGLWDRLAEALQSLDPFLSEVMGDSQTYVEHGVWAASARGVVESATIEMLRDPGVAGVTLIAHSAGCGVVYDALLEGRAIPEVLGTLPEGAGSGRDGGPPSTRLTLVTVGSAINRYHWLSQHARTKVARRYVERAIDPRVTGLAPGAPATNGDLSDDEKRRLQSQFCWVDIYARLDPVPAGRVRDEVLERARVHECQAKHRQVINVDNPIGDHGGYFENTGLVTPRLICAISGGADPWQLPSGKSWTFEGARRRVGRIAALQSVRLGLLLAAIAHVALLFFLDPYRAAFVRLRDWVVEQAVRLPLLEASDEPVHALTTLLLALASVVLVLAVERLVRELFFREFAG